MGVTGLLAMAIGVSAWPELARAASESAAMNPRLAMQPASEPVGISVVEDTGDRIVVKYELAKFREKTVSIGGQDYTEIHLGREGLMKDVVGAPELPHVARSIIIPDDAKMAARVLESDYYEITDISVPPSKGIISRKVNPADVPYTFGVQYDTDAFYPASVVELGLPYIQRDFRATVIDLRPFQYNAVTETLRVYTSVTVEVAATGLSPVNVKTRLFRADQVSLAFHRIYKRFLNYEAQQSRYASLGETGDMLIIYHDPWASNIQPLVDHKNNTMGINTTAVPVSTIGNNSTSIANYIQAEYDTGDLAFVLLVGDAEQVATPSSAGGASDPSYSKLAGSDDYPDIMVGRFSAQSAAEVDTQVARTIDYETMPATAQPWFKRGTGVASDQGVGDDGEYDNEHVDNIRTDLLNYGYTTVDQIYDPNGTDTQVTNALNAGRGIINYCGHGSATAWSSTGFNIADVNNLTNDNMLPFIFSVACVNGSFEDYTDCFAEAWLQATNGSEPTGAIAFYGSSVNQSWSPPMCAQDESVDLLVTEAYWSFGALAFAGSCQMMDEYGSAGVDMFDTWNVFGDPSVRVFGSVEPQCDYDSDCNDDLFCNGAEVCVEGLCQQGSDPCPGQACDEITDSCEEIECLDNVDCDDGSDCTVDTCVDGLCHNDYAAMVTSYPYTEGFESGWGSWVNAAGDDMDWTPHSGSTASSRTGPSSAHGGSYYVYTESSSPNYPDKSAILESPAFDLRNTSDADLTFWYHMYGSSMGTLGVEVSQNCADWTSVWSLSGDQGNSWYEASVDLSAYVGTTVVIRFYGVTGSSYRSDMAADDIRVDVTPATPCEDDSDCDDGVFCNGVETCVAEVCQDGTPIDCDDGIGCTDDSCNEAIDACDAVANDAYCSNGLYCDGAEFCDPESGCVSPPDIDCDDLVDCTYDWCNEAADSCENDPDHGYCDDGLFCNGAEVCDVALGCQAGGDPCSGGTCDEEIDACCTCVVDGDCDDGLYCNGQEICVSGCVCEAGTDPCAADQYCDETADTCEDVECVDNADCDDGSDCTVDTCVGGMCQNDYGVLVASYPYTEGFESGLGSWVDATGDDMDWTRHSGSTASSSTGPSSAHGGSYYVYTESSSPNYPDKSAILEGPAFDLSNTSDADLSFWYHMYGSSMGTLSVEVSQNCADWTSVWSLSGDQGNSWHEASVDLSAYVGATVVIRFYGVTGSSYRSDMAVDDIRVGVTPAVPCDGDSDCDDGLFCNGVEVCADSLCAPGSDPCPGQGCDENGDICVPGPVFEDDFESGNAMSWDLYGPGSTASTGDWEIGDPAGTSTDGDQAQPEDAYAGVGCAFTAQNTALGTDDVDGGVVYLISPTIDLSGSSSAELTYVRWFYNRDTGEDSGDFFVAEVSDDDGSSWVNLESLDTSQSANSWAQQSFTLENYVGLTSTVRVRFGAADGSSAGNIIEAAVDNVEVWGY